MDKKRMDLTINNTKPVFLNVLWGDVCVMFDSDKCFIEYSYSAFGNITPEIVTNEDEKNNINIKNSELIETDIFLCLPESISNCEIVVSKGNIIVQNGKGLVDAISHNGSIKIDNVNGTVKAVSLSGDVNVTNIKGALKLQSTNGFIRASSWSGEGGTIEAINGRVIVDILKLSSDVDVKAKNGKVVIGLSKGVPCTIIGRGTDVINYITKSTGEYLGSPAKVDYEGGGVKITAFSSTDKVLIARTEELGDVAPDLEKIFRDFEKRIRDSIKIDEVAKNLQDFGKKAGWFGKKIFDSFTKNMKDSDNNQSTNTQTNANVSNNPSGNGLSTEKMEVLRMLKEGKITPEEAEKLLNALK